MGTDPFPRLSIAKHDDASKNVIGLGGFLYSASVSGITISFVHHP